MSKTIFFLTAVMLALSSPVLAAGKKGDGGGRNATGQVSAQQPKKPQVRNIMKTHHDTAKNTVSNVSK